MFSLLAYSNYSIAFSEYIVVKANTLFTKYAGTPEAALGIYIMLLFWSVITIALPTRIPPFSANKYINYWRVESEGSVHFFYVIAINILLVLIWIFGFTRPSEIGERGTPSAIYEYSIVLFILCYFFGGKIKSVRVSTSIILMLFVLQNFVFGGRITGLQLLILFYLMCVEEKYSIKQIFPLLVVLLLVMYFIGAYRGNWIRTGFSLRSIIQTLKENLFTLDTAYSSYHTSLTFLLFGKNTTAAIKMNVFMNFLKSIIVGGYGTEANSIAHLTARFYAHYNGGVLPFFFFFFMGWSGVILIAGYVGIFIHQFSKRPTEISGLVKVLSIYFVSSAFRWYLYSPIQLTRGILIMAVAYLVSNAGIKTLNKPRVENR